MREEIRNGSTSLNGGNSAYATIYQPGTTADVVLKQLGTDGTGPATMINVSANTKGLYPAGRALGSSTLVSTKSINGRYISTATWFGTGGPYLGSQTTLPTWVFATRGNGIKVPAIANAKDPTNADYVIGRFAYTVYDIGGLLNANVAGYPSADSGDASYKSSLGFADLAQIPGMSAPANFITWRNGTDAASAAAYSAYVQNYGVPNGFLTTKIGDNAFLSRRDLLNFSQQSLGIPTTSLGYFTTFARSLNAPCWGPVADATSMGGTGSAYAYKTNANTSGTANRFLPNVRFTVAGTITHYHDDGTTETYAVTAGTPLIQRRFSLAKLAWLGSTGPQNGGSAAAIQACFGLQWENNPTLGADNSVTAGYGWVYSGSTVAASATPTALASIETLDQVAAENREPNFFELLQAGILSGVLGVNNQGYQAATSPATGLPYSVQANAFLHTLTIGANLIDQYKTDSYPTVLIGTWAGAADMITGTKSLPMVATYMEVAGANPALATSLSSYLTVNLWNPYVLPSNGSTGTQPNNPRACRGRLHAETIGWASNAGAATSSPVTTYQIPISAPADGWAQIAPSNFGTYANISPVTTSHRRLEFQLGHRADRAGRKTPGLSISRCRHFSQSAMRRWRPTRRATPTNDPAVEYLQNYLGTASNPFNIVAEYQSPSGTWIPYSFLDGINDPATWRTGQMVHWMNNSRVNSASSTTPKAFVLDPGADGPVRLEVRPALDPLQRDVVEHRDRAGDHRQSPVSATQQSGRLRPANRIAATIRSASFQQRGDREFSHLFFAGVARVSTTAPAVTTTIRTLTSMAWRRLADYGLFTGDTWASTPRMARPARRPSPRPIRPIILNRPFRSVGEIGYTFIDLPWRSINFCDHNNAFGGPARYLRADR